LASPVEYVQRDQPPGVPPLSLTGERTLPNVPEENYWYRRHLVVYDWIARRCAGLEVVDMACGEGYGSDVLSRRAARVTGVDANPEAHEHARLRYRRGNLSFKRDLVETYSQPCDALVFLQTIEHLQDPKAALEHFRTLLRPGAPKGAERSGNPWHIKEYRAAEFRELCESAFGSVEMYGLFHARKLRIHELAIRAGWDSLHPKLGITKRFYDWFTPAISVSDFKLRDRNLDKALDFLAVLRP
jgi:SAM-dependent methyltransferase